MARGGDTADRLSGVSTFSELSSRELKQLSRLMTDVQAKEGKELTREGEPGREFMIIVEGTAVVRKGSRKVAELGPGDFLGELAMLSGSPRNATVTATSDMQLEVLNRREFMSVLDTSPKLAKKILLGAVKRLSVVDTSKTS